MIVGALTGVIAALIFAFVAWEALPALRELGVGRFFSDPSWHPSASRYNLAPMLLGTVLVGVGLLIATVVLRRSTVGAGAST